MSNTPETSLTSTLLPRAELLPQTPASYARQIAELNRIQDGQAVTFDALDLVERAVRGAHQRLRLIRAGHDHDLLDWRSMAYMQTPRPDRMKHDNVHIFGVAVRATLATETGLHEVQEYLPVGTLATGRYGGITPLHGAASRYTKADTAAVYNALGDLAWAVGANTVPDLSADYTTIVPRFQETYKLSSSKS